MVGNSSGTLFRVSTFGESHGEALGVIVDGCPAGLSLDLELMQQDLDRRKPGQSKLTSPRKEPDTVEVLSGLFEGKTTGMPLAMLVRNQDVRSKDYSEIKDLFRPGHADFTYFAKYGHRDYRGGGRSSARETVARVMAGAVAKQLLATIGITFKGGVYQVGNVVAQRRDWEQARDNEVFSVDPDVVEAMCAEIQSARKDRDSVGGAVEVLAEGVPPGWGEPVFGKLDAAIAAAMLSIPAVRGVEFGAGFSCVSQRGSTYQDEMFVDGFHSNRHGGVLGGISSGAPIVVRIAIKPTSSIPQDKRTITTEFEPTSVATKGRHDPCVAIRAVPIAEAMLALVLVDYWLQDMAARGVRENFAPWHVPAYALKNSNEA